MLLTSSDTKRTLMHLFLFTNSAHRELVSICTQSIRYSAINFPCITTLELRRLSLHSFLFGIEHIFSWFYVIVSVLRCKINYFFQEKSCKGWTIPDWSTVQTFLQYFIKSSNWIVSSQKFSSSVKCPSRYDTVEPICI